MKTSFLAGTLTALVCCAAHGTPYPVKPVRLVVPFVAGGSGDVVGRLIGEQLTAAWGQQIIIDNKPGAAGIIGASNVARSPADGYSLLLADDSVLTITPQLQKELPFDIRRDFSPVIAAAKIEFLLSVNPSVPARSLATLIELLKLNPGKYSYASAGVGSIHHLSMEWLKRLAGVEMVHVPYKGSGQILTDLVAGQIPIGYTGLAQTKPFLKADKLVPIALGGIQRNPSEPNVPSIAETFPGFDGTTAWSILAPTGTPPDIVEKLNREINRILRDPAIASQLQSVGLTPIGGSSQELSTAITTNHEKWGRLIRQLNLRLD
ncbi:tripartite tricarboxylate transporter substrate binding protein [Pigmentiphaga sp.]|uniref:Bug family tripartite tricarboxylate transporter substrate binding protein n=1 Tax=Pigmentiphaga sp. TaxID=1977564 RepID=UPI00128D2201|nr:tripartite tricarboxylate transporter substrate binding protein [Pigmentiphaga sp.]MPS28455.1 tripartite tricarboxylate transporter substrate binding protein [Alcaligenaceae bacterium SAGV5]MPS52120.1 tripartite tricarboxylate transporter substrate binding protein [Alcaligenaceae bacterium SAGV3]MPT56276.1 tripartite tricarboxylate transporter substrate binding protein [Alcaligenaceae bacterium]